MMKLLRRLVFLAIVVGLGYGALWVWQSPFFAMYEINRGIEERDAVRVERYVDLEALVKSSADVFGALAKERIGVNGTDTGSQVLGALVGAIASKVGDVASLQGAMEVRKAIQDGRMKLTIGPFTVADGVAAYGPVQMFGTSAIVDLNGTCDGHPGQLRVVFEEKDGATFGYPKKWVLVGVDKGSLPALARACRSS